MDHKKLFLANCDIASILLIFLRFDQDIASQFWTCVIPSFLEGSPSNKCASKCCSAESCSIITWWLYSCSQLEIPLGHQRPCKQNQLRLMFSWSILKKIIWFQKQHLYTNIYKKISKHPSFSDPAGALGPGRPRRGRWEWHPGHQAGGRGVEILMGLKQMDQNRILEIYHLCQIYVKSMSNLCQIYVTCVTRVFCTWKCTLIYIVFEVVTYFIKTGFFDCWQSLEV